MGSEVGAVKPVLSQKLCKRVVVSAGSNAFVMSMSTAAEDMWHSVKVINDASIIIFRSTS